MGPSEKLRKQGVLTHTQNFTHSLKECIEPLSLIRDHVRRLSSHIAGYNAVLLLGPFVTPWTIACQASLSMRFSRQEYWSGLPCPPPGDLPNPGVEPRSSALQADSLSEPSGKPKAITLP